MANTTTQSTGQQYWSNQYNALKNGLNQAQDAVGKIKDIYGFTQQNPTPSLTSDQQRTLEQAYQRHLEASMAVTSFVNDTQGQLLRMSVTADALARDTSRSLSEREYARQTSATLQQRTTEFLQVKSSEAWQAPASLQYTIDNTIRATSVAGIVERGTDTSTTTGKVIAAWDSLKSLFSASLTDGAQTVQQLRDIGLNLANDYELCVAVMGIATGKAIKGLLPTPDIFKSGPALPFPLQMPWDQKTVGEKVYKDGVKSVITAEEEFCKIHLYKSDVKDLFRKYGVADDALFDRMDMLGIDEISLNVSREFFNQALATQTALSSLTHTPNLTVAAFDQQVRQTTASLASPATLMSTMADGLEAAGLEALDGARFGTNSFSVRDGQLYLETSSVGQQVVALASLDFTGPTLSDAGGGGALQLTQIQTINGQPGGSLLNSALQDDNINAHDILLGRDAPELTQLIATDFGKTFNDTDWNSYGFYSQQDVRTRLEQLGFADGVQFNSGGFNSTGSANSHLDNYQFNLNAQDYYQINSGDQFSISNERAYSPGVAVGSGAAYTVSSSASHAIGYMGGAQNWVSPLILDMDGDGVAIDLTHAYQEKVYFDIDNDNFAERVGWSNGQDALLAYDANGNSKIDNITELFGDDQMPAFQKLRNWDSNGDSKITAADKDANKLLLWMDRNKNGVTDAGELTSLDKAGVLSISLNDQPYLQSPYASSHGITSPYAQENYLSSATTFQMKDATGAVLTREIADVHFLNDNLNTWQLGAQSQVAGAQVQLNLQALMLPLSRGYGSLASLHLAMTDNQGLLQQVAQFASLKADQLGSAAARVDAILLEWAGVTSHDPTARETAQGSYMDARKVDFLEQFTGVTWAQRGVTSVVGEDASMGLKKAWAGIEQMMLNRLLIQGPLQSIFSNAKYDFSTDTISLNDSLATLLSRAQTYAAQAGQSRGEFWRQMGGILAEHHQQLGASVAQVDSAIRTTSGIELYLQERTLTVADGPLYTGKDAAAETVIAYVGGAGADTITGSTANDYLFGKEGNDSLSGGNGDDFMRGDAGDDTLDGGAGFDKLEGGDGNDRLYGGADSDQLAGGAGADQIYGGAGDDLIEGGAGADVLDGGEGMDTLRINTPGSINLATGVVSGVDQTGDVISNFENIGGSAYADQLTGDAKDNYINGEGGDDTLSGGAGNDYLFGSIGRDKMDGGDGDDIFMAFDGGDTMDGGNGRDVVYYDQPYLAAGLNGQGVTVDLTQGKVLAGIAIGDTLVNIESVWGSMLNDVITGDRADNTLGGQGGDDTLYGMAGRDTLFGGAGNDVLQGGAGGDRLEGGDGDDILAGNAAMDNAMDDSIDTLNGGAGNDTFMFSNLYGAARLDGSAGSDTLDLSQPGAAIAEFRRANGVGVYVSLAEAMASTYYQSSTGGYASEAFTKLTLAGVENARGTAQDDVLAGDANANRLEGGGGNDNLLGLGGDDTLDGGAGNDTLAGGKGDDLYVVDGPGDQVVENSAEGVDTVHSAVSYTLGANVENLTLLAYAGALNATGNALDNRITGNAAANVINGGDGDDILAGNAATDNIMDGTTDTLIGGTGNDTFMFSNLYGAARLDGSAGSDTLDLSQPGAAIADFRRANGVGVYVSLAEAMASTYYQSSTGGYASEAFTRLTLTSVENARGTAQDDVLAGDANANRLEGGGGNDNLLGLGGDDTLDGGAGTDTLDGGAGDDRYRFNLGGGQDTIVETAGNGNDRIVFGAGITAAQVRAGLANGRVTLSLASGESMSFAAPSLGSYAVEQFEFADGSVKDIAWLNSLANAAPTGTSKTLALNEDSGYAITAADLGFSDTNAGDTLSAVRIDTLAGAGSLKLNGVSVLAAQVVSAADLAAGRLVFSPAPNANGNNYASLAFSVKDQYGAFDAAPNTLSFNVTPVNDAPVLTGTKANLGAGTEDTAYAITRAGLLAGFSDVEGSALSVVNLSAGNGTLSAFNAAADSWTFTPNANYNGTVNLSYGVSDGTVVTPATQSFTLAAVNDAPVLTGAKTVLTAGTEDTTYTLTQASLLAGFSDVEGSALSVVNLSASNGSLSAFNAATGSWTFTPTANYNGTVNLSYGVSDGTAVTAATQNFALAPVNDAPKLTGVKATLSAGTEDTAYTLTQASLLAGFSDVDGSALSVVNLSASNGTLSAFNAATGAWTFTPTANFNGAVNLNYGVSDGSTTTSATQSFALAAVNDVPVLTSAKAALSAGTEDVAYTITQATLLAGFSDVDGNPLSVVNLNASNGTLSAFNAVTGSWTFSPNVNYNGTVNLSYGISDGTAITPATQNFTLAAVNDSPTGTATISGTPTQNQTLTAANTLADVDGLGAVSYQWMAGGAVIAGAANSSLTLTQAQVGKAISVKASYTDLKGTAESVTSASTAAVANVNDAPAGTVTISGIVSQNQTLSASNTLTDVDGLGAVSYQWLANGTAIAGATASTLALTQAQVGKTLSVTARYIDGFGAAENVTSAATSAVIDVNDAPTLTAFTAAVTTVNEDNEASVTLAQLQAQGNEADVDGTVSAFVIKSVSNGSLRIGATAAMATAWNAAGNNTVDATRNAYWIPAANTNGTLNAFTAVAKDNNGAESSVAIQAQVIVTPVNDAPMLTGTKATLAVGTEDTAYTLTQATLLAGFGDVEGSALSVVNLSASNGSLSAFNAATGSWTFTPTANYNGTVNLSYGVSDGTATTAATQSFALAPVNDAPTLSGAKAALTAGVEDTAYTITQASLLAGFSDLDGNTLSVVNLSASNGALSAFNAATSSWTFTPNANYNGTVNLSYGVSDGSTTTAATQSFALAAVNDVPVLTSAKAALIAGTEDTTYTITQASLLAGFSDVDGNPLSVVNLSASNGTLSAFNAATSSWTFTPNANYNGTVNLSYGVSDGSTTTAATQSFALAAVNDVPVLTSAKAALIAGTEDTTYTITQAGLLAGFSDVEGSALSVVNLTASNGTLSAFNAATGAWAFTPNANFNGTVNLNYGVSDGTVSTPATQSLTLVAVNDAPTLVAALAGQTATAGSAWNYAVPAATFADIDTADTLAWSASRADGSSLPGWLSFNAATRSFSGTPPAATAGLALRVTATDSAGASAAAPFSLTVADVPAIVGTAQADVLYGTANADLMRGLGGDDTLYGQAGADTLDGGAGNDALYGGAGNDSYLFYRGMGRDRVWDTDFAAGNVDTVQVAADISASELVVRGDGIDLTLSLAGSTDALVLQNWYIDRAYRVEQLRWGSGAAVSLSQLATTGTASSDTVYGTADADVLDGGAGNDTLYGGAGNDSYLFYRGMGWDRVWEADFTAGNVDTVQVAADISASELVVRGDGSNLTLSLAGSADALVLQNWYIDPAYRVEQLRWGSGAAVSLSQLASTGTASSDTVYGTASDDVLNGLGGDDTLYGQAGADSLDGGAGNDTLYGGPGNDSYLFYRGMGQDNVLDIDTTAGNVDTVQVAAGITPGELTVLRENSDHLYLGIAGGPERLTLMYFFSAQQSYQIEQLRFADGTVLDRAALRVLSQTGGSGNDTLYGDAAADTLSGLAGNDTLYGYGGDDVLQGGAGNDTLYGGAGNDSYRFGRGDGQDIVVDSDPIAGNTDMLQFLAGIKADQLWFARSGNDLQVSLVGTGDKATVQNWYLGTQFQVEQIGAGDNKVLLNTDVDRLVQAMAGLAPPAMGQTTLSVPLQTSLAPVLAANWH